MVVVKATTAQKAAGNFKLPVELGMLHDCEPKQARYINTDLKAIDSWSDFDQWASFKLALIDQKVWNDFSIPNIMDTELGYCVTVQEENDLHGLLNKLVFFLTKNVLSAIDKQYEKYDFFYNPRDSFDFVFKKRGDRNLFMVEAVCSRNWPDLGATSSAASTKQSQNHYERLYAYMTINQVEYAVVTTYKHTRFVKLDGQRFLVSEPFAHDQQNKHTVIGGLVALALHTTDYKTVTPASSVAERDLEFKVMPHNRGDYKCGVVSFKDGKYDTQAGLYIAHGDYHRASSSFQGKCVAKYQDISKYQCDRLQWEAEVYARLEWLQGEVIPECFTYGTIWDAYSMLVLQDAGRPMTLQDIVRIPNCRYKIMSLIKILHLYNLVHSDIRPSSFLVNEATNEIMVANLGQCQFTGAASRKLDEIFQVRSMISRAFDCMHSSYLHGPGANWRENKSRKMRSGWRRYSGRYQVLRHESYSLAIAVGETS